MVSMIEWWGVAFINFGLTFDNLQLLSCQPIGPQFWGARQGPSDDNPKPHQKRTEGAALAYMFRRRKLDQFSKFFSRPNTFARRARTLECSYILTTCTSLLTLLS